MENLSDEELMSLITEGDSQAFESLVKRNTKYFYNVAYRIILNREAAEDIVQNAFLKIWQKPKIWQPGKAKFKTWFYRIIFNLAVDDKRKFKSVITDIEIEDTTNSADVEIEKQDESKIIHKALSSIPARQRAAVMLVYFDEMAQKEAAEVMDLNIKAFESLLSRAKKELKEILKEK